MAIAHVCLGCGFDLARVRPARDPHYNLPLVTCPRCNSAVVRREHPVWKSWNKFRRLDFTITILGTQLIVAIILGALTILALIGMLILMQLRLIDNPMENEKWILGWVFGILAPTTGLWLTAGFRHLKWWQPWLAWIVFITSVFFIVLIGFCLMGEIPDEFGFTLSQIDILFRVQLVVSNVFIPGMFVFGLIIVCASAGIPLGHILLRTFVSVRRSLWKLRKRRRKMWRTAG